MRINQITLDTVKSWGRIDTDDDDGIISDLIIPAAKSRIYEYTGLSAADAEEKESLAVACIALCVFLYDNRSMNVLSDKQNAVIQSFLDAHCMNLV